MARFYGEVGYGVSVEDPPNSGVHVDKITKYSYYGDIVRNTQTLDDSATISANITVTNSISIVADEYATEHFFNIKYVRWEGVLWTVKSVEVRSPRLILNLGSVYNGPTP